MKKVELILTILFLILFGSTALNHYFSLGLDTLIIPFFFLFLTVGIATSFIYIILPAIKKMRSTEWRKEFVDPDEVVLFSIENVDIAYFVPTFVFLGWPLRYRYRIPLRLDDVTFTTKRILLTGDFLGQSKYYANYFLPFAGVTDNGRQIESFVGYIVSFTVEEEKGKKYLHIQMSHKKAKYKIYTQDADQIYQQLVEAGVYKPDPKLYTVV